MVAVGHDSANNMTADKRTHPYKRRTVFLQGRGLFPGRTRKRKAVGINKMSVSFGRITGQRWPYALSEGIWCCGKQGEFSKVMRLKSVAKVSIDPLGRFHRQHSKVSPEISKNKVFKPGIRRVPTLCCVGASSKAVLWFTQVAPRCQQLLPEGQTEMACLMYTSAILMGV